MAMNMDSWARMERMNSLRAKVRQFKIGDIVCVGGMADDSPNKGRIEKITGHEDGKPFDPRFTIRLSNDEVIETSPEGIEKASLLELLAENGRGWRQPPRPRSTLPPKSS